MLAHTRPLCRLAWLLAIFLIVLAKAEPTSFAFAQETGLPVPRFVSLKAHKVNVRRGPGIEYPILWQFRRRGLPVEIIAEYELWRQIRDYEGKTGWVHGNLLRGQRSVIILPAPYAPALRNAPSAKARVLGFLQAHNIATLDHCEKNWCKIKLKKTQYRRKIKGWVRREALWGIRPQK